MKIYQSTYKGIACTCVENSLLRAVFLPFQGAKLCSLVYLPTGREFALQSGTEKYQTAVYGQNYLDGECSGIDEMFPNIDACLYDASPWYGTPLPDHGEVWALPWEESCVGDGELSYSVHGIRLPYQLTKRISFIDENTLSCSYAVRNFSPFPVDYIWAAHMMLTSEKNCIFRFPSGLEKAYCTMSDSGLIGKYGDTFPFPFVPAPDDSVYDVRVHRGSDANDYQKFYFADSMPEGWGEISYPDEHKLRISFPEDRVPYLGAIQAEGGKLNIRCMFLEPCTGAFDRPDIAKAYGMNSVLSPYEEHTWYLNIKIETAD